MQSFIQRQVRAGKKMVEAVFPQFNQRFTIFLCEYSRTLFATIQKGVQAENVRLGTLVSPSTVCRKGLRQNLHTSDSAQSENRPSFGCTTSPFQNKTSRHFRPPLFPEFGVHCDVDGLPAGLQPSHSHIHLDVVECLEEYGLRVPQRIPLGTEFQ